MIQKSARKILFFCISVTLLLMVIVYGAFNTGRDIAQRDKQWVDAVTEIKLETNLAHRLFGQVISGDKTVVIDKVWSHLAQSQWYAHAMLDGGEDEKGTFLAPNDLALRDKTQQMLSALEHFQQLAQQSWNESLTSDLSATTEQQFEQAFLKYNLALEQVDSDLQRVIIEHRQKITLTEHLMIALILLMGSVISGLLLRYNAHLNKKIALLDKQKESLHGALNALSDAVFVTDKHGTITYLNPIAMQLTGWTSEQALGQPWTTVCHLVNALTREPVHNFAQKIPEGGLNGESFKHIIVIAKDGREYQIVGCGAYPCAIAKDAHSFAFAFRDLSEENARHASLESNQILLNTLLDIVPDLIWVKDLNGAYLHCNAKFAQLFAIQEKDIIGKSESNFLNQELADVLRKTDQQVLTMGVVTRNEEKLTFVGDGCIKFVEMIKTPLTDNHGQVIGLLGIARDTTHYKESLTQLTESESRLKEAQAQAKLGSWEQLFDNQALFWSDEVYRIFEYDLKIILTSRKFIARIHPDDRKKLAISFQTSIEKRTPYHMEYRLLFPDGRIKYIESRAEHFYDSNNKHIRSIGTIQDSTENKQSEKLLIASEARFKALMEQSPATVEIYNTDGYLINMNDAGKHLWGISGSNLSKFNLLKSEYIKNQGYLKYINKAYSGEVVHMPAHQFDPTAVSELAEGRKHWVTSTIYPLKDINNIVQNVVISHVDITLQMETQKKLQLYSRVFSDTHEGIIITDCRQIIIDVNPAFNQITGYAREDVIGKGTKILGSESTNKHLYSSMWKTVKEQGFWQGELWNNTKQGTPYAELLTISSLKNESDEVTHYVGMFSDITSSKRQQDQLAMMAHYDGLTKLPNRALLGDRFNQAIAHSHRTGHQLAVCCFDLDDFKYVNDTYGHDVGDCLLIKVATRIGSCIRKEDTVSRQGGDEFALLLNDIKSVTQYEQTIQRIHKALLLPFLVDGTEHNMSASSGGTLYPLDDGDLDILLRHANQAMYQSKLMGKNCYQLYSPDSDQRIMQKNHQLEEIKQALDKQEFQLYYQPKVNMVTGEVFGVEALIRWIHPEKGLIPPLDFLPIIDGTPLEISVGDWVINEALQQLDDWQAQGIKIQVSVNISSNHLLSGSFLNNLEHSLGKFSPSNVEHLQLEILESAAFGDINTITNIVEICQERLGVSFALDDFGTGYSSLTHLRRLPVNTIKIDQSFVRDMIDDPNDYSIIEGVIALSKLFHRNVIAEGVESTNHGLLLLLMGCQQVQGYGIAKPMPNSVFVHWMGNYVPNKSWLCCANQARNHKETSLEIFTIMSKQWIDKFISKINASSPESKSWPVIDYRYSQCGNWFNREKQDQLFTKEAIQRLTQAHNKILAIADVIKRQYEKGELADARTGLAELELARDEMDHAVTLCT